MARKTYAIYGMVEQSVVIPFAGGNIRVDFTHGSLSTAGVTPAKYKTDNVLVQKAIEGSAKYKKGIIKLFATEKEKAAPVSASTPAPAKQDVTDYPNVMNSQAAKSILMSSYGVPMSELGNTTAVKAKAKELGVTFSNWK